MPSPAFAVFQRLEAQVHTIRQVAARELAAGSGTAPVLYRSCIVLMVAAFDAYVHEQGVRLLQLRAAASPVAAEEVVSYLKGLTATQLAGPQASGLIRYRLSYKTLAAPNRIDELLLAAGLDPVAIWLAVSVALGSRPDRQRPQLQLQYDRRNQIAHEGDWDPVALELRAIEDAHVADCVKCIVDLVAQLDVALP
jgi:hypothetical protein